MEKINEMNFLNNSIYLLSEAQINYLLDNALLGSKSHVSLALWGEVEEKGELS